MIADMHIGKPIEYRGFRVFPLFGEQRGELIYALSEDAIDDGSVRVQEIDEDGFVPEVLAINRRPTRVLAVEGSPLLGARQDRVLSESVLIPGHAEVRLPVCCVEQGRWDYRSREFRSGRWIASPRIRWLQRRIAQRKRAGQRREQGRQVAVWQEIRRTQRTLGLSSETQSLADTMAAIHDQEAELDDRLGYVTGASGLLAFGGGMVVLDLFDKPATCSRLWDRLVRGVVLDACEHRDAEPPPGDWQATELLDELRHARWKPRRAVGAGEYYRADMHDGRVGCRVSFQRQSVHVSVVGLRSRHGTLQPGAGRMETPIPSAR